MRKMLIPAFLFTLFANSLWAQDLSRQTRKTRVIKRTQTKKATTLPISFNLGSHTEFVGFIQKNQDGGKNLFDFNPTIGIGTELPVVDEISFLPEINWVLPFKGSKKVIKNLFMIRGDLAYTYSFLRVRGGTSIMWQNMHGTGGSVEMNNGNTTSTFYYPNENHSSLNNTLDLGLEILTQSPISLRLQSYMYSPFKGEKRQLSYTIFATYTWGKDK